MVQQSRIQVQEVFHAPHDPVRPPSTKYIDLPAELVTAQPDTSMADAFSWFGDESVPYCPTMSMQDYDIRNRFWSRHVITNYFETVSTGTVFVQKNHMDWLVGFSNQKSYVAFQEWFFKQNKNYLLPVVMRDREMLTEMETWIRNEVSGRREINRVDQYSHVNIKVNVHIENQVEATAFKLRWHNVPEEEDG
jgi:hypothetical protein